MKIKKKLTTIKKDRNFNQLQISTDQLKKINGGNDDIIINDELGL